MLSYPWGCLWHEGCAPSFLSGPHLDKHCRYLILYHALVYIINFYPNHLYMISHPNFNFNLSILRKMILHVEPYLPYKFFFISTYILHERLKFIQFFFFIFWYNPHKNNSEKATHDERSKEMLMLCQMHSIIPIMFHYSWDIYLFFNICHGCVFRMVPT